MILAGKKVVLGVSGSIAAFRAADVASQLSQLGADVHVILTEHATSFIGAPTFRALTRNEVLVDLFDEPNSREIAHIELGQSADLILVAPASANIIAKMAHGVADDLLTTVLLATTAPVMVAPAMNSQMLAHPATQQNLTVLAERGIELIDSSYGVLACRTEGYGKLAPVAEIVSRVVEKLSRGKDFLGRRLLVTAGATREPIDPVRFLSNHSSGKMGFAVAAAARSRGASVCLVSGFTTVPPPHGVELIRVGTTEEMLNACLRRKGEWDAVVGCAAPADYRPIEVAREKMKKGDSGAPISLTLHETPDILGALTADKGERIAVGFAAETSDLLAHASEKIVRKRLDLMVANDVTAEGAGFDSDTNIVTFLWPDGRIEKLDKQPKLQVAHALLDRLLPLLTPGESAATS